MELKGAYDIEQLNSTSRIQHELWPLDGIDPKKAKFPCCLIWTPLPVVSWLAPFIGHVGICREDGTILDFSGSNFVNVDDFAFGAAARYLQLDREQCCFPPNLAGHSCEHGYKHSEYGTAITWDDALQSRALDRLEVGNKILPALRSCALLRCSFGWLALLSWAVLILSPPYGVVSVGHLLFQKPVRMLELMQPTLVALFWVS
ncbi:unnamed protein product [Dovyalis caffra]|uniref:Uncharacterized protein n=1 Tax=Dovyalis caffra TaxID=77055 RepID=A0AAV1SJX9_9ROSI|nr:unnamed protein product [Dovyalis caffra]